MDNNNTKIIKTFRGEIIFLISFVIFVAGILGAYYNLVKDVAVMKNEYLNQTALLKTHIEGYDKHVSINQEDHDILTTIKYKLGI